MLLHDELKREFKNVVGRAGQMVRQYHGKVRKSDIQHKATHDFVTEIDKQVEKFLVEEFTRLLPGSGFLTEEETVRKTRGEFKWIIDPIDGTTNFIHGLFPVTVSVALRYREETIMGIVYEIGLNELYYADETGAYLNEKPIKVSAENNLENALIATGFPFKNYDRLEDYMKSFEYLMFHTSGIRRLGSAAADLVYVAAGRMDGFYEYGLNPWDVAAGAFIVMKAGGKISDFSGKARWLYGGEILATNALIHDEFLQVLRRFFDK